MAAGLVEPEQVGAFEFGGELLSVAGGELASAVEDEVGGRARGGASFVDEGANGVDVGFAAVGEWRRGYREREGAVAGGAGLLHIGGVGNEGHDANFEASWAAEDLINGRFGLLAEAVEHRHDGSGRERGREGAVEDGVGAGGAGREGIDRRKE